VLEMFAPTAAALADRVPYWGLVGDDVVLTATGQTALLRRGAAVLHRRAYARGPRLGDGRLAKLLGSIQSPHGAFLLFRRIEMQVPTDFDDRENVAALARRKRLAYVCNDVRRMQAVLVVCYGSKL